MAASTTTVARAERAATPPARTSENGADARPDASAAGQAGAIPVSVIVMTKNEEANIAKCLRSVAEFDQVFVVDSGSTDATASIAAGHGAEVVDFRWNGRYPKKKQWCLDTLPFRHDWVLYVDADEEVGPEVTAEIRALTSAPGGPAHAGYFVGYDYVFLGRVLRHGRQVFKLVLMDRRRGRFEPYDDLDAQNMWEVEGHYQPVIDGTTGVLKARMLHADHDSLFHYFDRHNRYSDWEATIRLKGALSTANEAQLPLRAWLKRAFDRMPMKGLLAFVDSYVVNLGFLDGRAGFHFAVARGVYFWQIGLKTRELRERR